MKTMHFIKVQFLQIFHTSTTYNVRIQAVGKVLSSDNIHENSVLSKLIPVNTGYLQATATPSTE